MATLSRTFFHGSTASAWNMYPTPSGMPLTGDPCTLTVPAVAGSSPETRDRVVDLPQPVGPTIETNSPSATSRSTSRIAVKPAPSKVGKRFVARLSVIAEAVARWGAGVVVWVMTQDRTARVTAFTLLRALWLIPAQTPFCAFCPPRRRRDDRPTVRRCAALRGGAVEEVVDWRSARRRSWPWRCC